MCFVESRCFSGIPDFENVTAGYSIGYNIFFCNSTLEGFFLTLYIVFFS